jgi:TonB family protein
MAAQQGIYGIVRVLVDLDETGAVTGAKIISSPSVLLNGASLAAARKSKYEPAMRACEAVSSHYAFTVEFSAHQFR